MTSRVTSNDHHNRSAYWDKAGADVSFQVCASCRGALGSWRRPEEKGLRQPDLIEALFLKRATSRKTPLLVLILSVLAPLLASSPASILLAQQSQASVPVMTGRYHFLGPEDELAILQEETMLKGFIDVFQGENESDAILSYQVTEGSRNGDGVEFTTRAIHEKYYRFTGTVERGKGKKPGDPDYLQLVGVLETCTNNSVTGKTRVGRQSVLFKSMGKGEREP